MKRIVLYLACFTLLAGCLSKGSYTSLPGTVSPTLYPQSADYYLQTAENLPDAEQQTYFIKAAGRLIEDGHRDRAQQLLTQVQQKPLSTEQKNEITILEAQIALYNKKPQQAIDGLRQVSNPLQLPRYQRMQFHQILAEAYDQRNNPIGSARQYMTLAQLFPQQASNYYDHIWHELSKASQKSLQQAAEQHPSSEFRAWLELVAISQDTSSAATMQHAVAQWQKQYPSHPGNMTINTNIDMAPPQAQQIALLLPFQGPLNNAGNAVRDGFMTAYYQANQSSAIPTQVRFYDTSKGNIKDIYQQAVNEGATLVVGPLDKKDVQTLSHSNLSVPTISLNYTNDRRSPNNLYQFGLSPLDEAQQAANRARRDGHRQAIMIYPDDNWGRDVAYAFRQQWQAQGGQIVNQLAFKPEQDVHQAIKQLLNINNSEERQQQLSTTLKNQVNHTPRRRQDVDMIFLAASPGDARQIQPLLKYYYAGDIPVYSPSIVYAGKNNPIEDRDLDGIRFSDIPWIFNDDYNNRLYALGVDAFTLAQQLQQWQIFPHARMTGKTGVLSQIASGRVYRTTQWGQFVDGKPAKT